MSMPRRWLLLCLAAAALAANAEAPRRFGVDDLARLADVAEPGLSPDGAALVYSVSTANTKEDQSQSDLWRVGYDGRGRVQLTHTPKHSESRPLWSPDGASIAYLSDAPAPRKSEPGKAGDADKEEEEEEISQVWLMPAAGGNARRITTFTSGVDDYVWSPDGKRLAVIVRDPERGPGAAKPKNPPPIVTSRYQFKEDGTGYLDHRRTHLYVVDIATGRAEQITTGDHDELLPAWSPDGTLIAYVTKRGADPDRHLDFDIHVVEPKAGASERQLTTFAGADSILTGKRARPGAPTAAASPTCKAAKTSGSTTRRGSWPSSMSPQANHGSPRRWTCASPSRAGRRTAGTSTRWSNAAASPGWRRSTSTAASSPNSPTATASTTTWRSRETTAWWCSAAPTRDRTSWPRWKRTDCGR